MTRLWTIALALSTAILGVYGCDEPTPEESLSKELDRYEDIRNEQVDIACDCYAEFMHADREACIEALGEIRPARRRCLDDAFNQDVVASRSWLDCILPLEIESRDCIDEKLDCDNIAASQACVDDYDLGEKECISLPQSVQRDVDDCFK